jgi:hypothetical protein
MCFLTEKLRNYLLLFYSTGSITEGDAITAAEAVTVGTTNSVRVFDIKTVADATI